MIRFSKKKLDKQLVSEITKSGLGTERGPANLAVDDLIFLKLSYVDFAGNEHNDGEMIVHKAISDQVLYIFKILYQYRFPINKICLVSNYDGSDELSMADNNSSAFNCRMIKNTERFSSHSHGLAIDLNPVQNPAIFPKQNNLVEPSAGANYLNRSDIRPGMVETILIPEQNLNVIKLFKQNGFSIWGGDWKDPVDYQHFQSILKT